MAAARRTPLLLLAVLVACTAFAASRDLEEDREEGAATAMPSDPAVRFVAVERVGASPNVDDRTPPADPDDDNSDPVDLRPLRLYRRAEPGAADAPSSWSHRLRRGIRRLLFPSFLPSSDDGEATDAGSSDDGEARRENIDVDDDADRQPPHAWATAGGAVARAVSQWTEGLADIAQRQNGDGWLLASLASSVRTIAQGTANIAGLGSQPNRERKETHLSRHDGLATEEEHDGAAFPSVFVDSANNDDEDHDHLTLDDIADDDDDDDVLDMAFTIWKRQQLRAYRQRSTADGGGGLCHSRVVGREGDKAGFSCRKGVAASPQAVLARVRRGRKAARARAPWSAVTQPRIFAKIPRGSLPLDGPTASKHRRLLARRGDWPRDSHSGQLEARPVVSSQRDTIFPSAGGAVSRAARRRRAFSSLDDVLVPTRTANPSALQGTNKGGLPYCIDGVVAVPATSTFDCKFVDPVTNATWNVTNMTAGEFAALEQDKKNQCVPNTLGRQCICSYDSTLATDKTGDIFCLSRPVSCRTRIVTPTPNTGLPAEIRGDGRGRDDPANEPLHVPAVAITDKQRTGAVNITFQVACEFPPLDAQDLAAFGISINLEPVNRWAGNETTAVSSAAGGQNTSSLMLVVINASTASGDGAWNRTVPQYNYSGIGTYDAISRTAFRYCEPLGMPMPITRTHPLMQTGYFYMRIMNFWVLSDVSGMGLQLLPDNPPYPSSASTGEPLPPPRTFLNISFAAAGTLNNVTNITFPVDVAALPDRFVAGQRVYIEAGIHDGYADGLAEGGIAAGDFVVLEFGQSDIVATSSGAALRSVAQKNARFIIGGVVAVVAVILYAVVAVRVFRWRRTVSGATSDPNDAATRER